MLALVDVIIQIRLTVLHMA